MSYSMPLPPTKRPHFVQITCENEVTETVLSAITAAATQVVADTIGGAVHIVAQQHDGFAHFAMCDPAPDPVVPKDTRRMPPWYNVDDRVYYAGQGEGGNTPGTVIEKRIEPREPENPEGLEEYRVRWDDDSEAIDHLGEGPRWFVATELLTA